MTGPDALTDLLDTYLDVLGLASIIVCRMAGLGGLPISVWWIAAQTEDQRRQGRARASQG